MQRDVVFSLKDDILVAAIMCDIDHHAAKPMREKIDKKLCELRPAALLIDFSEVVFMDSSGLGLIMGRAEYAESIGCRVAVSGLSPSLRKLMTLCGLDRVKNLSVLEKERNFKR